MPIPAVEQYPTRTPHNVRGRRSYGPFGRWATIELIEAGSDIEWRIDREQVINISMTNPPERPPELPGLAGAGEDITDRYFLERVPEGVKIGMVRGGSIEAVGGFGYAADDQKSSLILREDGGLLLREDGGVFIREHL